MASLTVQGLRQAIAAKVDAIPNFSEARLPFSGFGRTAQTVAHLRFAINMGRSTRHRPSNRQRTREGVALGSEITIRFAYMIRPRDGLTDYDLALEQERLLISAVLTGDFSTSAPSLKLEYLNSNRELVGDGEWIVVDTTFLGYHFLSI